VQVVASLALVITEESPAICDWLMWRDIPHVVNMVDMILVDMWWT
jgi:hypothetical protein